MVMVLLVSGMRMASAASILVFGDSLSAGYGLARQESWPHLLAERLRRDHPHYTVVNASISGETTQGGLRRIDEALQRHRPAIVVLALGANDGLRGSSLTAMRANLKRMIEASRKSGAAVLLVGMRIPPNYGPDYTKKFAGTFSEIAKTTGIALVPFLLEGFADQPNYFQADQLHPTAAAQPKILDTLWPPLERLIKNNKNR